MTPRGSAPAQEPVQLAPAARRRLSTLTAPLPIHEYSDGRHNMKFTFTIESHGEQATEEPGGLTYDLLRETADKVDAGHDEGVLMDANGNTVGAWSLEREA